MAKITDKLQVTLPKKSAEQYHLRSGGEIQDVNERLELFDAATTRQRNRQARANRRGQARGGGWTREDLYQCGRPD